MLSVKFKSVDTTYATRDFATDAAISATRNVTARDKQLTPWDGPDATSDEDLSLDTDLGTGKVGLITKSHSYSFTKLVKLWTLTNLSN